MKIPFSVFSAHHGYRWSSIPTGMTGTQLDTYQKIISAARPEGMKEGEWFDGVLCDGHVVVVFRAMRVSEWDSVKRTSHYYAVAFISRKDCHLIDIDQLLNGDLFKTPTREPPVEIEYTGASSATTPPEVVSSIRAGKTDTLNISFRFCGDLLSRNGSLGDKWKFFRTNIQSWRGTAFAFEPSKYSSLFAPSAPVGKEPFAAVRSQRLAESVYPTVGRTPTSGSAWMNPSGHFGNSSGGQCPLDGKLVLQKLEAAVSRLTIIVASLCIATLCLLAAVAVGGYFVFFHRSDGKPVKKEVFKEKETTATVKPTETDAKSNAAKLAEKTSVAGGKNAENKQKDSKEGQGFQQPSRFRPKTEK